MEPQQPKRLRDYLFLLAMLALVLGANAWVMFIHPEEQLAEPVAHSCPPVPIGGMQNRACLGREPKIVIWGDSQAHSWIPMAQALGRKLNLPSTNLARDGCPPLPGARLTLRWPQEAVDCEQWNQEATHYLRDKGADTLIIVARWRNFIRPGLDNGAASAIGSAIAKVSPHVRRILVIAPTPEFPGNRQSTTYAEYESDTAAARRSLQSLTTNPKVQLVDPTLWLCDGARCLTVREGNALYSDWFHVSYYTAANYGELFATTYR
jgi:hypothetical protein